jgi:hypothetical protein
MSNVPDNFLSMYNVLTCFMCKCLTHKLILLLKSQSKLLQMNALAKCNPVLTFNKSVFVFSCCIQNGKYFLMLYVTFVLMYRYGVMAYFD